MDPKQEHIEYIKKHKKFIIDCSKFIFSEDQTLILEKYGHWFNTLTNEILKPTTELQKQFISVAKKEIKPSTIYEIAWNKYLGRKKLEIENPEIFLIKYKLDDDTLYTRDD